MPEIHFSTVHPRRGSPATKIRRFGCFSAEMVVTPAFPSLPGFRFAQMSLVHLGKQG
jgi:hypothetical protein